MSWDRIRIFRNNRAFAVHAVHINGRIAFRARIRSDRIQRAVDVHLRRAAEAGRMDIPVNQRAKVQIIRGDKVQKRGYSERYDDPRRRFYENN